MAFLAFGEDLVLVGAERFIVDSFAAVAGAFRVFVAEDVFVRAVDDVDA